LAQALGELGQIAFEVSEFQRHHQGVRHCLERISLRDAIAGLRLGGDPDPPASPLGFSAEFAGAGSDGGESG
jgi:hypothetical protein